jgi:hypothetical protein
VHDERVTQLEERVVALEAMARARPLEPDYLYVPSEVADYLRCGKANVYNLMSTGALAVTKIGAGSKGLKVKGSDILLFLDDRKEGGPSPKGNYKFLKL